MLAAIGRSCIFESLGWKKLCGRRVSNFFQCMFFDWCSEGHFVIGKDLLASGIPSKHVSKPIPQTLNPMNLILGSLPFHSRAQLIDMRDRHWFFSYVKYVGQQGAHLYYVGYEQVKTNILKHYPKYPKIIARTQITCKTITYNLTLC